MRKTNLAFIIGFIVCFAAAYRGMVFSPSFTMMYVVAGMGLCILGEILDMAQAGKRFGSSWKRSAVWNLAGMDVENQRNSGSSVGKSSGIAGFTGSSTVGCILRNQ